MKTLSAGLKSHIAEETTALATCWKLTRSDNTVMGFTDHDMDITFESVIYEADAGFTPSAVATNSEMSVDNLDLEGLLSSASITENDIAAGFYDNASIDIFMVNVSDLSQGKLWLRSGTIGEIILIDGQFVAEVRGLLQSFTQTIGDLYSPMCRAKLGDVKCGVNLVSYTVTGSITNVTSQQVFTDSSRTEDDGTFSFGTITFTSGLNNGQVMEVKYYDSGTITTVLPMPYTVAVNDAYSMVAGCDKTFPTCIERFSNALNFRGEPHVPGTDEMFKTSGTF